MIKQELLKISWLDEQNARQKLLHNLNFHICHSELCFLFGPNASGKTTLLTALLRQQNLSPTYGLSTMFIPKDIPLAENMTVLDLIILGMTDKGKGPFYHPKSLLPSILQAMDELGFQLPLKEKGSRLSRRDRLFLKLLHGYINQVNLFLLDEPLSGISSRTAFDILNCFDRMKSLTRCSFLIATHNFITALPYADRIFILEKGSLIASFDTNNRQLIPDAACIGSLLTKSPKNELTIPVSKPFNCVTTTPVFEARSVSVDDGLPVDFSVLSGEVLGMTSLDAEGVKDLLEAIRGRKTLFSGCFYYHGYAWSPKKHKNLTKEKICFFHGNRAPEWLVQPMSVADNIALIALPRLSKTFFLSKNQRTYPAASCSKDLVNIDDRRRRSSRFLSYGTDKRIALARCFAQHSDLLILIEPEQNLDEQAHAELLHLIKNEVDHGSAVLLFSQNLSDLSILCNRILVFQENYKTTLLTGQECVPENILSILLDSDHV